MTKEEIKKELDKIEDAMFMCQMADFMDHEEYRRLYNRKCELEELYKEELISKIEVGDLVEFENRGSLYVTRLDFIEKNKIGTPVYDNYFMTTKNKENRTNEDAEGPVLLKTLAIRIVEKYNK